MTKNIRRRIYVQNHKKETRKMLEILSNPTLRIIEGLSTMI